MLLLRFHPCVSVPARDRLFTADDLRRHALLLKGATFLAPRSFLAAAHRCSAHHFLASRHSSGASGSTPAALSCRERRPGQPGFSLRKIRMTCSVFYLLRLLIDFSWRACFFLRPVFLKNKKCNSNVSTHVDAFFFLPTMCRCFLLLQKQHRKRIKMCLIWLALISCLKRIPCRAR